MRWQHTASPYGPVYLLIAKAIVTVAGHNVIVGTLLQRLVELVGVAMIVWALPRLARICGFDPVAALWLGRAEPAGAVPPHRRRPQRGADARARCWPAWSSPGSGRWSFGVVVITLGVGIKATAGMALAFLVIMLALRAGGRWRDLLRCGVQVGAGRGRHLRRRSPGLPGSDSAGWRRSARPARCGRSSRCPPRWASVPGRPACCWASVTTPRPRWTSCNRSAR